MRDRHRVEERKKDVHRMKERERERKRADKILIDVRLNLYLHFMQMFTDLN